MGQSTNARVHATTHRVVNEHFAEERPRLQALPTGPFQAVLRLERRITKDGMVSVDGNLYSVADHQIDPKGTVLLRSPSAARRNRSVLLLVAFRQCEREVG